MIDGEEDTCWNSDQGSPQWVHVTFDDAVTVREVHIKFQGGFVGQECHIEGLVKGSGSKALTKIQTFYPEDVNSLQIFKLETECSLTALRIVFNNSTDFFG